MINRIRLLPIGIAAVAATLAAGCTHTDPVVALDPPREGPFGTASPVRLTFNPGQDFGPSYSDDGNSIVYTYEAGGRVDRDRCLGILPADGGTRLADVCEQKPGSADSTDAFTAGALDGRGQLLFLHATSRIGAGLPRLTRLQLSDTTYGTAPRTILTLPINLAGNGIDWLTNIRWTGDDTFLALAQLMTLVPLGGAARDTSFINVGVLRGIITGDVATVALIPGTGGASSYGISEDGSAVIVTGGVPLARVPVAGGASTPILLSGIGTVSEVDCRMGRCVGLAGSTLYRFAESGGTASVIEDAGTLLRGSIRISPTQNDFVLARGFPGRDLYLYRGFF